MIPPRAEKSMLLMFRNSKSMNKKLILVVEDDPALSQAAKLKLEKANFDVAAFFSAEEALLWLSSHRPDFIWLDILLPGMSGIDFLQKLRTIDDYKAIPVMVVSVSMDPDRMKRAFDLSVVDIVFKSEHELKDIVDQVVGYFESCSGEC
jgi:CheY-like chemotaxis protein